MCKCRQGAADPDRRNGNQRDEHGGTEPIDAGGPAVLGNAEPSPAVAERVRRLEEAGVIRGYRLELNPVTLGLPIAAYVRIRPNAGQLPRIAELAQQIPEVVECHRVTGEDCLVLKVYISAIDQLDRLLDAFLLYGSTTTTIIQSSPVPLRQPPLPDRTMPE